MLIPYLFITRCVFVALRHKSAVFQRLRLRCHKLLSSFASNFNSRQYTLDALAEDVDAQVDAAGRRMSASNRRMSRASVTSAGVPRLLTVGPGIC